MKYLIYARVSPRGDQEKETSIKMQIEMCKEYVRSHNGEVFDVLSDEFFSGKNMNRPGFKELMAQLDSGQAEWDVICVYKLSRLTRSLKDGAAIFDKLYKWNKGFVSITEKSLDFSTPSGRAMLGILQVFNQFEREQIAENTRNKLISIAKRGLWPVGKAPFGYKRGETGDNKLYIDPRKAEIVKDVFESYISEKFASADIIRKYKTHIKNRQRLMDILRRRTYTGMIEYADHVFPGQHEPIISKELFDKVQSIIPEGKRSAQTRSERHPYILSGLVKCHCGRHMTPASAKSSKYHYYQCTDTITCKNRVSAIKLEEAAINFVKKIKLTPGIIAGLKIKLEKEKKKYVSTLRPELNNAETALSQAQQEKEKLYQTIISGKLTDSAISFFNERFDSIEKEIDSLQSKIEYLRAQCMNDGDIFKFAEKAINSLKYFSNALCTAPDDPDVQRPIILANVEQIQEIEDGNFVFRFTFSSEKRTEWGG